MYLDSPATSILSVSFARTSCSAWLTPGVETELSAVSISKPAENAAFHVTAFQLLLLQFISVALFKSCSNISWFKGWF